VRALCHSLGVPLAEARWDCAARMRRRGTRGEAGLRALRREYLLKCMRRAGATAIATAHTADDQLETLLMRLARGTGWTGAAGMRARRGVWLKPLLLATRADIERDLVQHGVSWREDASNVSPAFTRNRIRHGAIPALLDALGVPAAPASERRAGLAARAARLAAELNEGRRLLVRAADRALERGGAGSGLDVRGLARLSPVLRRLALERAWRRFGPGEQAPGLMTRHLAPLVQALGAGRARAEVALPKGWRARIWRGRLRFAPPGMDMGRLPGPRRRAGRADARLGDRHRRARNAAV